MAIRTGPPGNSLPTAGGGSRASLRVSSFLDGVRCRKRSLRLAAFRLDQMRRYRWPGLLELPRRYANRGDAPVPWLRQLMGPDDSLRSGAFRTLGVPAS